MHTKDPFPIFSPLPTFIPLEVPTKIIKIFKQSQTPSLNLSEVPEQSEEDDSYKQLYDEKCKQETQLLQKCMNYVSVIREL